MSTATLTSKGQTTIPKEIRDYLDLQPGDRIEFTVRENTVELRAATRKVTDLKGFLPKPAKPLSLSAMDAAIRKRAARQ
ncbi:MAG TPA: AbrB/MazE/SpoVT family DNA-binding domain-containing protein [Rudaea sp.]|jgi:AbrB family looped-hinge helix DNA binding protein|uniref:AbrB/MazE/SpoVT family DNA-binding domain-containing protein n=1 Tax=Rudaea sp. TaxID=2136325 RepID=UPI002F92C537